MALHLMTVGWKQCSIGHAGKRLFQINGAYTPAVERPADAVTAAVLALQMAQRDVELLIREVIERVSADPFAEASHPDFRVRLSKLREEVDRAADELIDALARVGDSPQPD
jgi:hypothetical protein